MRKIIFIILVCLLTIAASDAGDIKSQTFKFTYNFTIKNIPGDAKEIRFWIPFPPEGKSQSVIKTEIDLPIKHEITEDGKYQNKIIYGAYQNKGKSQLTGTLTYHLKRNERLGKPVDVGDTGKNSYPAGLDKYLQSGNLVTISPKIKALAQSITKGKVTPLGKAKAIYDYVFENMEYNKETPGWGFGDSERACDIKKGNCTDFHSLFISLARASGIPAKFVIGFNVPPKKESVIKGYHCWAEFYLNGSGWIPVDISKAWKDKSRKEYYFGNLDQNRIEFSIGRDITLNPAQEGDPLNYFIYPYLEIDGNMVFGIETSFECELL